MNNLITLFEGTENESIYDLDSDLLFVDFDECDGDILLTLDLCGITLEYINTNEGLTLDSAYILDGGYCYIDKEQFNIPELKAIADMHILNNI